MVLVRFESGDTPPVLSEELESISGVLVGNQVLVSVHITMRRGLVNLDMFLLAPDTSTAAAAAVREVRM